jgi:hypothetical protein
MAWLQSFPNHVTYYHFFSKMENNMMKNQANHHDVACEICVFSSDTQLSHELQNH